MACPYSELFIYQLEGRMGARAAIAEPSFLGHWQEEESAFLFFSSPATQAVTTLLRSQPHLRLLDSTQMTYDQWQGASFCGERIGRFAFVAPWDPPPSADHENAATAPILLDPGLVFGAGTHPTTRDCLQAIEQATPAGGAGKALDLGTGTGILALAMARQGLKVLAVDLNPLAAATARRNVRLNRLEDSILVIQGRAEEFIESPADLVAANIHGEVMLRLLEAPGFRNHPRYVLSGLMRSDAKEVRRRLSQLEFQISAEWVRDGIWHTYYATSRLAPIS